MRRQITGFSNPTIKRLKSLREKKHRKREGLFLAEGLRISDRSLAGRDSTGNSGRSRRNSELHPLAQNLEKATIAAGGEVIETSEAIIAKLTGKSNPTVDCRHLQRPPDALA